MPISAANSFATRDKLNVGAQVFEIQRLEKLEEQGLSHIDKLPFSLRILLENLLRFEDGDLCTQTTSSRWQSGRRTGRKEK